MPITIVLHRKKEIFEMPMFLYYSDFDGDGKPDNISFMIKRIKVHTNQSLNDPKYRFPGNYGVEKFLEIFSGKQSVVTFQL